MRKWVPVVVLALAVTTLAVVSAFVAQQRRPASPTIQNETTSNNPTTPTATNSSEETEEAEEAPSPPLRPSPPPPAPVSGYPAEVSKCVGNSKRVNFSFDGGAGSHSIASILSVLDKHEVKGTFFLTGNWASANASWVQEMGTLGHEVFNHTLTHPDLKTLSNEEIRRQFRDAETIISGLTGKTTKPYFRPPYGSRDSRVWSVAWAEGYRSIYWTIDALDWQTTATDDFVKDRVISLLRPGAIIMMHIGDDITGRVLDDLLHTIKGQGYEIVSLKECLT